MKVSSKSWLVFLLLSRFSIGYSINWINIGDYYHIVADLRKNNNEYFYYTDYELIKYKY
jgi:hypothetical protein